MSELSDKIAYIKGLCAGLDFDANTAQGKLLMAIVDALGSIKDELDDVRSQHEDLEEYVDILDDDLEELENEVYGDADIDDEDEDDGDDDFDIDDDEDYDDDEDESDAEDECDDDCCECGHHHHHHHELGEDVMNQPLAERPCPACGKPIAISMRALFNKEEPIVCPHCGGKFRAHEPGDDM